MDHVLEGAALLAGVAPDAGSALTRQLQLVGFDPGHVFFTEGDVQDWLFIIASGKVTIGSRASDGRENLSTVRGPADMFGEMSAFDPGPRTSTAKALTAVRAAVLPREVLLGWISERPEIAERLLRVLARRLRRTNHDLSDLIFTDVAGRVAKHLLRLAQQFGVQDGDAVRVTHDLTQEELARLVGAARETVNKALGDFVARGWISVHGKTVLIADTQQLHHRARETGMRSALTARPFAAEAAGILMEQLGVDDTRAAHELIRRSQDAGTSVSEVAADIVHRQQRPPQFLIASTRAAPYGRKHPNEGRRSWAGAVVSTTRVAPGHLARRRLNATSCASATTRVDAPIGRWETSRLATPSMPRSSRRAYGLVLAIGPWPSWVTVGDDVCLPRRPGAPFCVDEAIDSQDDRVTGLPQSPACFARPFLAHPARLRHTDNRWPIRKCGESAQQQVEVCTGGGEQRITHAVQDTAERGRPHKCAPGRQPASVTTSGLHPRPSPVTQNTVCATVSSGRLLTLVVHSH